MVYLSVCFQDCNPFKIQQLELLHVLGNLCIVYKILSLIYKAINGAVLGYICDLLNYCTSKGTLRSSVQYPLATPKARLKTCGERTFPVAGPGLWKSIPLGIRSSSSIDSFFLNFFFVFFLFFLNNFILTFDLHSYNFTFIK